MSAAKSEASWRGDAMGGLLSALVVLPASMAYGLLVFAPLGPSFASAGVLTGLVALCLNVVIAPLLGRGKIDCASPAALSSLMLSSLLTVLLFSQTKGGATSANQVSLVLVMFFLIVALSGFFQAVFALLRFGEIAKFMPYPVISGLFNGTAILIVLGQLGMVLGIPNASSLGDVLANTGAIQPLTLSVAVLTCAATWLLPRLWSKLPGALAGLVVGTGSYMTFSSIFGPQRIGPVLGEIPAGLPTPKYFAPFWESLQKPATWQWVIEFLPSILGLSAIVSILSLVTLVAEDTLLQERSSKSRELFAQGVGNFFAGLCGGILSAGHTAATVTNYRYGGRTRRSRLFQMLFILSVLVFLHRGVAQLPRVVLSGLLIVAAFHCIDLWSLKMLRTLFREGHWRERTQISIKLGVSLCVTTLMVTLGPLYALLAGFVVSALHFIFRMGKQVVYRSYSVAQIQSHAQRPQQELEMLASHGDKVQIFELCGALFFGTADNVALRVEEALGHGACVILLDFKRVSDVDSTGTQILFQLLAKCRGRGVRLMLCSVMPNTDTHAALRTSGVLHAVGDEHYFRELEEAVANAEDQLLEQLLGADRYTHLHTLAEVDAFQNFHADELAVLERYLVREEYAHDAQVFAEGDEGDALFIILQGRILIFKEGKTQTRHRLAILCPGTLFGEMALLSGAPRTASAVAEGVLICAKLSHDAVEGLRLEHPSVAFQLMAGLGRELSTRLNIRTRTALELRS